MKSRPERRELLRSAPDSLMQQDYKSTIAATVEFAIPVLKSEAAADLFGLCSIASPDHIPYDLLRSFHARQGSGAVTESGFSAILKELCDHSLITAADDGDTACCFDIHRLVQTVRQDWMQAYRDSSMRVVSAAVETAADLFNFDFLRNVGSACGSRAAYYASLAPHCSSIAKFAQELCLEDSEDLGLLQINLAEYLYETCKQSDGAIDLLCTARNSAKSDVLKMRATVLLARFQHDKDIDAKQRAVAELADALECLVPQMDDHFYEIEAHSIAASLNIYLGRYDEGRERLAYRRQ